jgi:hypothetical protein
LHAHQRDNSGTPSQPPQDAFRPNARIGFVEGCYGDLNVVAKHAAFLAIERETIHDRKRVRGNGGTEPLDNIPVVIVVGRLDQHHEELLTALASRVFVA